jgi:hypothetical protein
MLAKMSTIDHLVGGLEHFLFFHILGIITQLGLKPPTSHVLQPALFFHSLHLAFTSSRLFYGFMALQEADGTIDSPLKKYVMWDVP